MTKNKIGGGQSGPKRVLLWVKEGERGFGFKRKTGGGGGGPWGEKGPFGGNEYCINILGGGASCPRAGGAGTRGGSAFLSRGTFFVWFLKVEKRGEKLSAGLKRPW